MWICSIEGIDILFDVVKVFLMIFGHLDQVFHDLDIVPFKGCHFLDVAFGKLLIH
jgi:hypothetical protein